MATRFLLLATLLFSPATFAKESQQSSKNPLKNSKVQLAPPKKTLPSGKSRPYSGMLYDTHYSPARPTNGKGVRLSAGCTNSVGRSFTSHEAGYESCLSETQSTTSPQGKPAEVGPKLEFNSGP